MRSYEQISASSMDRKSENIQEHIRSIYEHLYNFTDDSNELKAISDELNLKMNTTHLNDGLKVTPGLVKEASSHIKYDKTDPIFSFSTDCIKNGPDLLFEKLSLVNKSFLIHGHVTVLLPLATLVPMIKDKLGSIDKITNWS